MGLNMKQQTERMLERLLEVVENLYAETANLSDLDADLQLWYNRGYADGMVKAMRSLGHARELKAVARIEPTPMSEAQTFLPWGKAYRHGFEMGENETIDVLGD
jgi:hypothetical protein